MKRLLLAGLLLTGCSALGYQPATLSVSRDAVIYRAGRASAIHDFAAPIVTDLCAERKLSPELCRAAAAAEGEYQALAVVYRQALLEKRVPPDPDKLIAAAEKVIGLVGPLLLKAGLGLPGVGL
jgi:hypothetical protein